MLKKTKTYRSGVNFHEPRLTIFSRTVDKGLIFNTGPSCKNLISKIISFFLYVRQDQKIDPEANCH